MALLNDQIKGELVVQDVDLSWWNGFPNISVDLWEAALTLPASSDTLLAATRIGVEMDVWTLWNNRPELSSLTWSGGHLQVVEMPDGSWNALVHVELDPEDSTADLRLDGSCWKTSWWKPRSATADCGKGAFARWTPPSKGVGIGLGMCMRPRSNSRTQMSLNLHPLDVEGGRSADVGRRHRLGIPRHGHLVRLGRRLERGPTAQPTP